MGESRRFRLYRSETVDRITDLREVGKRMRGHFIGVSEIGDDNANGEDASA